MKTLVRTVVVACAGFLTACGLGGASSSGSKEAEPAAVQEYATPAVCGAGASPETGMQGQVSLADRESGRSQLGYWCNLELVGQHKGEGASWQHTWYEDCAYYDTSYPSGQGVQVIDVGVPSAPRKTAALQTPAMLDPWESLKANEKRGLLGADAGWNLAGPAFFDVYDLVPDCTQPKLLASVPMAGIGHEGDWAPDGLTYYVGTLPPYAIIDVANPQAPVTIAREENVGSGHGLSLTDDGNRMYAVGASCGNGLKIFDTTQVQNRTPNPAMPVIGEVCWEDGSTAQHTIPVTIKGKPYVIFVDEGGAGGSLAINAGAARIIDISDETKPVVISKMKLEIHNPEFEAIQSEDIAGNGGFGYQAHYCGVDQRHEATVLGCGYFQSGLRIFDIRDPYHPKEIAYYNPPAQGGRSLPASNRHFPAYSGPSNSGYASSQVRFIKERGEVWFTDQDSGFIVVRFTNGAWPFGDGR